MATSKYHTVVVRDIGYTVDRCIPCVIELELSKLLLMDGQPPKTLPALVGVSICYVQVSLTLPLS